jgi:hypothetical protein
LVLGFHAITQENIIHRRGCFAGFGCDTSAKIPERVKLHPDKYNRVVCTAKEYLISHGWLLIPAAIAGAVILAFGLFVLGGMEQNGCAGFRYFAFIDHKATADGYSIQLINGNSPVIVREVVVGSASDSTPDVSMENVQPHNAFSIKTRPLNIQPGSPFSNTMISVRYDIINGEPGKTDTAWCAGRVAV